MADKIYTVVDPTGKLRKISGPEGATDEEVIAQAQALFGARQSEPAYDPTEGMSTTEKLAAGAGKAFTDIYRGARQLLPGENKELEAEIEESRRLDASLMRTGAGKIGNLAGNIAALVPAAFIPGANTYAGAGALGAAAGLLEPTVAGESKIANAALGSVAGVGGQALGRGLGRLIRPVSPKLTPAQMAMTDVARTEQIPLRTSQVTGSKPVAWAESALENLPATSGRQVAEKAGQQKAFTQAVLKRAGIDSAEATPEVLATKKLELGKMFEDIAGRNTLDFNKQLKSGKALVDELSDVAGRAAKELPPAEAARISKVVDDILSQANEKGVMAGSNYQGWRTPLGRLSGSPTETAYYFGQVKKALDKGFSEQISKADADVWKMASKQYGNLKTVLDAMGGSSVVGTNVQPAQLAAALTRATGKEGRALGRGELTELSKVGKALVSESLPDSGTAQRAFYQNLLTGSLPGVIPGAAYGAYQGGGPENILSGALIGGASAVMLPKAAQAAMLSKIGRNYLSRGMIPLTESGRNILGTSARNAALAAALSNQ